MTSTPPAATLLPRAIQPALQRALEALPVVVVTGARQSGKSTLVRRLGPEAGRAYVTLDDLAVRDQAVRAPEDLLARGARMTIDEVQKVPELLSAIKIIVDRERTPGQFILTGSANLLLMKQVSESLAGRAAYLALGPLTRREQLGLGTAGLWDALVDSPASAWPDILSDDVAPQESWQDLAARGGFPTPAHEMRSTAARAVWFEGYLRTYLERDLQDVAAIGDLSDFRRLMRVVCLRLGNLINQADMARDVALPPSTAARHLNLLDVSCQLVRLPAYAVNRTRRLIKSPKGYWTDTGLAMHLADEAEPRGAHLENVVLGDLLAWRSTRVPAPEILYWRTTKGAEVDFVIETVAGLLPIEIKTTARPGPRDARHLAAFRDEYGDQVLGALLLHDGDEIFWLGKRILAAPWWRVI